jgi:3-oxoadipate enol-lactonase
MLIYNDIGEGTPIVFIHGLGSTKEAWEPQYSLAKKYRLIIPDLRGHGETELDEGISVSNFAKDIIELLDYLEIPSAYICGLSLGGIIAQEINLQKPSVVKGLILSNTTFYVPYIAYNIVNKSRREYKGEGFARGIAERGLYNHQYVDMATKTFNIRDTYIESSKSAIGRNYFPFNFSAKPLLLIGGKYDKVTPPINMCIFKLCNWNSDLVILEAGHLSNIEQRIEYNKAIDKFIIRSFK